MADPSGGQQLSFLSQVFSGLEGLAGEPDSWPAGSFPAVEATLFPEVQPDVKRQTTQSGVEKPACLPASQPASLPPSLPPILPSSLPPSLPPPLLPYQVPTGLGLAEIPRSGKRQTELKVAFKTHRQLTSGNTLHFPRKARYTEKLTRFTEPCLRHISETEVKT